MMDDRKMKITQLVYQTISCHWSLASPRVKHQKTMVFNVFIGVQRHKMAKVSFYVHFSYAAKTLWYYQTG